MCLCSVTAIKERYEKEMAETAKVLDELELEKAKMRPLYEDHPKLEEKLVQQSKLSVDRLLHDGVCCMMEYVRCIYKQGARPSDYQTAHCPGILCMECVSVCVLRRGSGE